METITVKTRFIPATDDAGDEIDVRVADPGEAGVVKSCPRPYPYYYGGIEAHEYMARRALVERYGRSDATLTVAKTTERGYVFSASWPSE